MKTQNVLVDVGSKKGSDIFFVQGEQGRELTFKVYNSMLEDFVNLAGYTATIHILKSDGNFTIENMVVNEVDSECYYTLTANDCACGGRGFYDVSLSKNDELIYTFHGDFIGDFRSVNDDSVNSVSVAYGVTFPEGFQMKLTAGDNITIVNNVISAIVREYHNGTGIDISNDIISISENVLETIAGKQDELTAGEGIDITNNVIKATGGTYKKTVLYENSAGGTGQITLEDSVLNYDAIYVECLFNGNQFFTNTILKETLQKIGSYYLSLASYVNVYVGITTNSTATSFDTFGSGVNGITKILGINY